MIRLTIPLIFISFVEAMFMYLLLINRMRLFKYVAVILLVLYAVWNYFGIRVHEETSTYLLENRIFKNAKKYFSENKSEILKHDAIYFQDKTFDLPRGWNGSEKLKLSLSGQSFLDYYFPGSKLKAVYGFENNTIPANAYIIDSKILLK
jgi:Ca2+/Na+ antiporter